MLVVTRIWQTPNITHILYCVFAFTPLEGNTEHQTSFEENDVVRYQKSEKMVQKDEF